MTSYLKTLDAGDAVWMSAPRGVYDHKHTLEYNGPLVFIAAGTGITPMFSIIQDLVEKRKEKRQKNPNELAPPPIVLVYQNRKQGFLSHLPDDRILTHHRMYNAYVHRTEDILLRKDLLGFQSTANETRPEHMHVHFLLNVAPVEAEPTICSGKLTAEDLQSFLVPALSEVSLQRPFFLVCGPNGFVTHARGCIQKAARATSLSGYRSGNLELSSSSSAHVGFPHDPEHDVFVF